uniref:Uncharacterized protein n=1 Tax=Globodera rostochiensis TaxID=31243 RepID=A0A914HC91_GLORO
MSSNSSLFWRILCSLSVLSLTHSAYSAAQHRSYLRLVGQPFTHLPVDLIAQTLLSLLAAIVSTSFVVGDFQPIRADLLVAKKSWDVLGNCPSFYVFNHRAKYACTVSARRFPSPAALDYCVKIVQERDYENYMAILQMTKSAQPRLFSVLALNAEIASLRHKIKRGSGLAGINQLTFWKDALQMFGQNAQKTLLPRQPVMTALSAFGSREDVPLLLQLVSARQQTLGDRPFADVHALESNARALYGTMIRLQMHALHDATAATQDGEHRQQMLEYEDCQRAVDAMACAVGILTLLRATVLLLRDGVMLLPQDLTTLHGVSVEMAYRKPNSLKEVVRDLCEISTRHLHTARSPSCIDSVRPELRPALLTCGLRADHVLTLLNSNDFNLLDVRLHQRHPMSAWKLWWRNRCKKY